MAAPATPAAAPAFWTLERKEINNKEKAKYGGFMRTRALAAQGKTLQWHTHLYTATSVGVEEAEEERGGGVQGINSPLEVFRPN